MMRIAPAMLFLAVLAGCNGSSNGVGDTKAALPPSQPAAGIFQDITAGSGIQFTYRNGEEAGHFAILESLGGGVALLDYNRDGLLDIFVTGGGHYGPAKEILGHPCKLYRNLGNWKFQDVTSEAGLDPIPFYNHGAAAADYDNDGWTDLLVTGYGRLALFHNRQGRFEEVAQAAGLLTNRPLHWSTSAAWCDLDGDQLPDLYLAHYVNWHITRNHPRCADSKGDRQDVCSPKQYEGLDHQLFLNNGDGTFRDGSQAAGLKPSKGLGVLIFDANGDGKQDIYAANDTVDNFLYLNQGGGRFLEQATELGVARDENGVPNGSMGVDAADYDGTGHFSLFVTNYQHEAHALYRNRGDGPFTYASSRAGIMAIGLIYVGFGTVFLDYDNDGNEDLFITNGHVVRHPPPPGTLRQKPVLLRNSRKPSDKPFEVRFEEITAQGGPFFQTPHQGRGAASGDLDNDGKIDLVVSHLNEPVALLKNTADNRYHWLGVELVGKTNKDAIGARLTLEAGGRRLVRAIRGGRSYLSTCDRRTVFGLANDARADRLTVQWPSGKTQTWTAAELKVDQYQRLEEP